MGVLRITIEGARQLDSGGEGKKMLLRLPLVEYPPHFLSLTALTVPHIH
jgi:hypothetical protein